MSKNNQGSDQSLTFGAMKEFNTARGDEFSIAINNKVNRRVRRISFSTVSYSERHELGSKLQKYFICLQEWSCRYDFQLWDKVENHFNSLWPELNQALHLGIEYGLYEEVKNLFFEMRNLLQWTGRIKDRIYFAAWLKREAEQRQDAGTRYLAISSLVWSYTSSGCYQSLDKAYDLWKELASYLIATDKPVCFNTLSNSLIDSLGSSLYVELIVDAYENGVRIAIRRREFDNAFLRIHQGEEKIKMLFEQNFIPPRLQERFRLAFQYHKGIICYLMHEHDEAEKLFQRILDCANLIGWNRVIKGAKSWMATLAMERKQYDKCEEILTHLVEDNPNMSDKRDGFCHLIKAQLFARKGQKEEKIACEKKATKVFEKCNNNDASCNVYSFILLSCKQQ